MKMLNFIIMKELFKLVGICVAKCFQILLTFALVVLAVVANLLVGSLISTQPRISYIAHDKLFVKLLYVIPKDFSSLLCLRV